MSNMNQVENVAQQYSDDKNLSIRTNLHIKYSTNKKGLVPWLFEQYKFPDHCRILELGCGNGGQWENRIEGLPAGSSLILSDFSEGMVNIVKEKYQRYPNVLCRQIDIEDIPFENNTFDVVIANHMLYHVPDLSRALSEVCRVLKNDGRFYCTTNGNGGMQTFLRDAMKRIDSNSTFFTQEFSFSLQNGAEILKKHFRHVVRLDYEDSLSITKTQDLIDWMKSTTSISAYSEKDMDSLFDYFEAMRKADGSIHIPKECGLFICQNAEK